MNPKIEPGGRGRIQYLLRCAFKAAGEGDKVEAMHYWHTAIGEGYEPRDRILRQLHFRIREGESSLDLPNDAARPAGQITGLASRMISRGKKIDEADGLAGGRVDGSH